LKPRLTVHLPPCHKVYARRLRIAAEAPRADAGGAHASRPAAIVVVDMGLAAERRRCHVLSGQRVVITAPPTPANVEALVSWSAGSQGTFLAEALTQVCPTRP